MSLYLHIYKHIEGMSHDLLGSYSEVFCLNAQVVWFTNVAM